MKKPIAPETDQLSSLRAISYHYSADGNAHSPIVNGRI